MSRLKIAGAAGSRVSPWVMAADRHPRSGVYIALCAFVLSEVKWPNQ